MSKQRNQIYKVSLMVISLFILAACGSTSGTDEADAAESPGQESAGNDRGADTSSGGDRDELTQEEIRQENALRQTVFYFDFDIAEFKAADRETLTYHARNLAANSGMRIRLEGHADERGSREYNMALGESRGNAARDFLIQEGVNGSLIEVVSYGEEQAASSGGDEKSWTLNRRVELK